MPRATYFPPRESSIACGAKALSYGFNSDGRDLELSKNAPTENRTPDIGDDRTVTKSGWNVDGWKRNALSENTTACNRETKDGYGGAAAGSETLGGHKNSPAENRKTDSLNSECATCTKINNRCGGATENTHACNAEAGERCEVAPKTNS